MKIKLRKWNNQDTQPLVHLANNPNIANYLRDVFPSPYQAKDAAFFIQLCQQADSNTDLPFAITVDGSLVGSIGLTRQVDVKRKSAELGYWIGEEYWNKGVATQAVKQICEIGWNYWDINRIYAEVFSNNLASCQVLKKSGFQQEGILQKSIFKNGNFFDSILFSKIQ